jgi:hypothetical protein
MSPLLTVASQKGPAEQRENQGQRQLYGYGTPGITQCIPSVPGPPLLGQYAPAIPVSHSVLPPSTPFPRVHIQPFLSRFSLQEVTNDGPPSHVPLPQNIAGPSQGNYSVVHSRMSAAEDLKNVASHYLHNPGSHVDKLRMRRSRSGAVQVLILLEIDDAM